MARRRVVTGLDPRGASVVVSDQPSPARIEVGDAQFEEIWAFDSVPTDLSDTSDPTSFQPFRISPSAGRVVGRIFTIPPATRPLNAQERQQWVNSLDFTETNTVHNDPGMHQTPTIDITVVISGEMDLVLDSGESVHLRSGDSVVQRGTMHAWRNPGSEPCVAVAFMVRAK